MIGSCCRADGKADTGRTLLLSLESSLRSLPSPSDPIVGLDGNDGERRKDRSFGCGAIPVSEWL